jgi:hypothetical protein
MHHVAMMARVNMIPEPQTFKQAPRKTQMGRCDE